MHRGSSSAHAASLKLTLCFSRFVFAFSGSHVQRNRFLVYTKLYLRSHCMSIGLHRLLAIIWAACWRLVSVTLAPETILAIS